MSTAVSSSHVRIKICGVTHEEHVFAAAENGADFVGLVLWPQSPRAVTIDRAQTLADVARLRGLEVVVLLVDPNNSTLAACSFADRVQCHGSEDCEFLGGITRPTIKGFPFDVGSLHAWDACPHVGALLVDGPRGGGGESFCHADLAPHIGRLTKPLFLAGGLRPSTVAAAMAAVRPFAVDVSSGVERTRGIKDPELIRAFCRAVRESDVS